MTTREPCSKVATLIAESETRTRNALEALCLRRPDLDVVGRVDSGTRAIQAIESCKPELLLLDAHLSDMNAFDVIRAARAPALKTIIVTSDMPPDVQDTTSNTLAYLTKPVERKAFEMAIDTAVARSRPCAAAVSGAEPFTHPAPSRLLIGERARRFHFLEASTVDYLEVDGNYVTIHVGDERFLTRSTLKQLAALLAANDFVRINRSHVVNLRRVAHVERLEGGHFAFTLRHGQRLISCRERSGEIARLLKNPVY